MVEGSQKALILVSWGITYRRLTSHFNLLRTLTMLGFLSTVRTHLF